MNGAGTGKASACAKYLMFVMFDNGVGLPANPDGSLSVEELKDLRFSLRSDYIPALT